MTGGEPKYNSKTADKFVVRLPEGMRNQISLEARRNHRSMNSEIVSRLDATLSEDYQPPGGPDVNGEGTANGARESAESALVPVVLTESELKFLRRLRQLNERKRRALYEIVC